MKMGERGCDGVDREFRSGGWGWDGRASHTLFFSPVSPMTVRSAQSGLDMCVCLSTEKFRTNPPQKLQTPETPEGAQ